MTIDALIMFFGTFVAVLPFLGFPSSIDRVLLLIAGVCIIGLGIAVRRRGLRPASRPSSFERRGVGHETTQGE